MTDFLNVDFVWIVATGLAASFLCSWLGLHLVLRRQAMMSDALSHSVLPGLVLVYILFGSLNSFGILLGATVTGVVTALLIEVLKRQQLLKEDAATGLVFTTLFAIGVVLLQVYAGNAHIDTQCLLYGELAFVPLENLIWGMPQSFVHIGSLLLSMGALLILFHKELLLTAFHEEMAQSSGLPVRAIQYGLMIAVSAVIIACFQALGAVLVIAFLVLPASFGLLLSRDFKSTLLWSWALSLVCVPIATWIAFVIDNNIAANIVALEFGVFVVAFIVQREIEKRVRVRIH
ncbi:metal ABC transporter permease [bacterium]|nr:metal ABC transporter permease [bacterium]